MVRKVSDTLFRLALGFKILVDSYTGDDALKQERLLIEVKAAHGIVMLKIKNRAVRTKWIWIFGYPTWEVRPCPDGSYMSTKPNQKGCF